MKVLVVGTGGVGAAVAAVAKRRDFFERMTFADLDPARPRELVEREGDSEAPTGNTEQIHSATRYFECLGARVRSAAVASGVKN